MRFLILTQYYAPEVGAPQVRLGSFARELRRHGHSVVVVTGMPNYPGGVVHEGYRGRALVREDVAGVPVVRTWLYATNSARFIPRLASYLSFCATSLFALPFTGEVDLILVESPPLFLGITARLMALVRRAPWAMVVSDLWPDTVVEMGMIGRGPALSAAFALERWLYRSADFVVGVTQGICQRLLEAKGLLPQKVMFLPNGADTTLFQPRPRDAALEARLGLAGRSLFLFAGLHGHAQDLPTLIEAADRLRDRPDIRLGFVGDGPVKAWAVEEAARRGLTNVFFEAPQPLEAMPAYWSLATGALVSLRDMPLFDGARPSKSFPPMASGVPVLFTGKGEMRALLEQADAGLVVPAEDPGALAAAIRRLADEDGLAARLGGNARALVLAQFSWTSIASEWLADLERRLQEGSTVGGST